jgi:hypothetical protein
MKETLWRSLSRRCRRAQQLAARQRVQQRHDLAHLLPRPVSLATRRRQPFLVVATPLPGLPTVTLFRDIWFDKIAKNHVEMAGREDAVQVVVASPTAICRGSANPGYLVFLNSSIRSPGGSAPLTVYVDPLHRVIVSAYYNRSFARITPDQVIWQPSPNPEPKRRG